MKNDGWHKKAAKEELRNYLSPWEAIIFAEPCGSESTAADAAGYHDASRLLHKRVYRPIGAYIEQERIRAGFTRTQVEVALGYVSTADPTQGTALCYRWEEGSSLPTKEAYLKLRAFLNNGHTSEYLRQDYEDLRQDYDALRRPFFLTAHDPYTDVWSFAPCLPSPEKHPCEKPLALLSHIIKTSSRPGDLILDCCAGEATTLEAAKRLGRKAIGIEQEARWCRRGQSRLQQEVFALLEATLAPQPSAHTGAREDPRQCLLL